jgi:hypothetical protein
MRNMMPAYKIFSNAFHLVLLTLALTQKNGFQTRLRSNRGILFFFYVIANEEALRFM